MSIANKNKYKIKGDGALFERLLMGTMPVTFRVDSSCKRGYFLPNIGQTEQCISSTCTLKSFSIMFAVKSSLMD